jgi:hypothetical protein
VEGLKKMPTKLKNYKKFVYNLRFSLEIEAEFPEKINTTELRARYRKLLGSWTVTTDYSLNNGLEFKPTNKNKLKFTPECFAEIAEIMKIIRIHKGKVDGKTCGLHVHIDMTRVSNKDLLKIIKESYAKQLYIIKDFKVRQERLKKYCKPLTKKEVSKLNVNVLEQFRSDPKYVLNNEYLQNKYYLLNIKSLLEFNTIEFRLFNGTKYMRDIKKIMKYIFEFLINALERE